MSEFSRDELAVLAGARRALDPSAQDAARVLHKARLAIGSGVAPAADGSATSSTAGSGIAKGMLAKKALGWLAVAGISAWLGYYAGFTAGEQRAREATVANVRVQPALAAPAAPPAPALAPEPVALVAPAVEVVEPTIAARAKAPRATLSVANARASTPLPAPEIAAPDAPQPSASLDTEIKALRYVERALRNREPHNALARLEQLDREVPEGQMREERDAARAMARCEERASRGAPEQAEVMQRVLEFSQRYPASVYFARVRQTCLATIERAAATD